MADDSVGLRGACPSEARALAALTVRKPGNASKNPIAEGDSKRIFACNCEGTEQLRWGLKGIRYE